MSRDPDQSLIQRVIAPFLASFWLKVISVAFLYLLLQVGVLLGTGDGWQKFWVLQPSKTFQYWDAIHYAGLSLQASCSAFYPLWPRLIALIAVPETVDQALKVAIPASELMFLVSLPLALFTFEQVIQPRRFALIAFLLYALGPNTIFYAIGYTESLFGFLSLLLLLSLHRAEQLQAEPLQEDRKQRLWLYAAVFGLSALLNLVRPALLQSGFSIVATWLSIRLICSLSSADMPQPQRRLNPTPIAMMIGLGSLLGYSIYGGYCFNTVGDFLGPFQAQIAWGRTLAFRPWLMLFPRSLLMDLHGLYLPALIAAALGWLIYSVSRHRSQMFLTLPKQVWLYLLLIHPLVFSTVMLALSKLSSKFSKRWTSQVVLHSPIERLQCLSSFTVLYAISFSGIHSAINFLANSGYLYSTARHYFGSPYAFVAIGSTLAAFSSPRLTRLSRAVFAVGLILLMDQWLDYGSGQWLG